MSTTINEQPRDQSMPQNVLKDVTIEKNNQMQMQHNAAYTWEDCILAQIVNEMIDDQSAIVAYKTIFRAKSMKSMRKQRDLMVKEAVRKACFEVAEEAMEQQVDSEAAAVGASQVLAEQNAESPADLLSLELEPQQTRITNDEATNSKLHEDAVSIDILRPSLLPQSDLQNLGSPEKDHADSANLLIDSKYQLFN